MTKYPDIMDKQLLKQKIALLNFMKATNEGGRKDARIAALEKDIERYKTK